MNNIKDFQKCSNCGACYNICPTGAISTNEHGLFYTISVDAEKCISCGLCKKVCPVNEKILKQSIISAYGIIINDEDVLKKSSSGGAFSALAQEILNRGGVVFGAVYADEYRKIIISSTQKNTFDDIRRSKYVESKVEFSFREVKSLLERGKEVLYCGAPCQIAGLKSFLQRKYDNLLTCDFSCGGMPSHKMYEEWLDSIEKKLKSKINSVNFRYKAYGWSNCVVQVTTENNKKYQQIYYDDPFYYVFLCSRNSIRDYCMECEFGNNHYSDIILADLWKYKSISNIRNNNKGISLVITNSQKGEQMIKSISKKVALTVLDTEKASYNLYDRRSSEDDKNKRQDFLKKCEKNGFWGAVKGKKLKSNIKFRIKYLIKKMLGRN